MQITNAHQQVSEQEHLSLSWPLFLLALVTCFSSSSGFFSIGRKLADFAFLELFVDGSFSRCKTLFLFLVP